MAAPGIRSNPYTNPLDLYNALYSARETGPVSDPYNLNAALRSIGASYGRLSDQVRSAAVAEAESNMESERQRQGYYPAYVGSSTAGMQWGEQDIRNRMAAAQDVEQAWQAARAALPNEQPGSDAFNEYMLSHINTRAGAKEITPKVMEGYQRQLTQSMQKQAAKAYIDQQIRNNFVKQYLKDNKGGILEYADQNGLTPQNANEMLMAAAENLADQKVQQLNVQPDIDPRTGEITLYDPQGRQVPLNFAAKAAIQQMASQFSDPYKISKELEAQAAARRKQDWLMAPPVGPGTPSKKEAAAKPIALKDQPGYAKAAAVYKEAAAARRALIGKDVDPDLRKQILDEYEEAKKGLAAFDRQPGGGTTDQFKSLLGIGGPGMAQPEGQPGGNPYSAAITEQPEEEQSTASQGPGFWDRLFGIGSPIAAPTPGGISETPPPSGYRRIPGLGALVPLFGEE